MFPRGSQPLALGPQGCSALSWAAGTSPRHQWKRAGGFGAQLLTQANAPGRGNFQAEVEGGLASRRADGQVMQQQLNSSPADSPADQALAREVLLGQPWEPTPASKPRGCGQCNIFILFIFTLTLTFILLLRWLSAFAAKLISVLGTCPPTAHNNLPIYGTFICG